MRISFQLEPSDIQRFQHALLRSRRLAECADEIDLIDAAKQTLDQLNAIAVPSYVRARLVHVQRLIVMLEDDAWSLAAPERIEALAILAYFSDPDDLIPDTVDVIGLLDDAIMLELVARELRHVFRAYADFCSYRSGQHAAGDDCTARMRLAGVLASRRAALHLRMRRQSERMRLVALPQ